MIAYHNISTPFSSHQILEYPINKSRKYYHIPTYLSVYKLEHRLVVMLVLILNMRANVPKLSMHFCNKTIDSQKLYSHFTFPLKETTCLKAKRMYTFRFKTMVVLESGSTKWIYWNGDNFGIVILCCAVPNP